MIRVTFALATQANLIGRYSGRIHAFAFRLASIRRCNQSWIYAYYNSDKFVFYGEDLMKRAMAYRSFLDAGVKAAAGSDFSPGPFAPLMGIQGMVTRTGWNGETWGANQRISVDEALQIK